MWILDWFVNLDNVISLLKPTLQKYFSSSKPISYSGKWCWLLTADLHSSAKLPQIVTKLKGKVNLWMNVAENLLSQKCFVFRDSFEGKRYQIAETRFLELKIYHFVGKSCKPAMFHTSCLCELVKRGWVIVSGNLRGRHSPSQLSLAAVYKKFLALKLHEHSIAVFAVFAMFTRFSVTIF